MAKEGKLTKRQKEILVKYVKKMLLVNNNINVVKL